MPAERPCSAGFSVAGEDSTPPVRLVAETVLFVFVEEPSLQTAVVSRGRGGGPDSGALLSGEHQHGPISVDQDEASEQRAVGAVQIDVRRRPRDLAQPGQQTLDLRGVACSSADVVEQHIADGVRYSLGQMASVMPATKSPASAAATPFFRESFEKTRTRYGVEEGVGSESAGETVCWAMVLLCAFYSADDEVVGVTSGLRGETMCPPDAETHPMQMTTICATIVRIAAVMRRALRNFEMLIRNGAPREPPSWLLFRESPRFARFVFASHPER